MAETPAVCEHLHLPLQSGSDRVLAAMHRGYTAERYLERLRRGPGRRSPTWPSPPTSSSASPARPTTTSSARSRWWPRPATTAPTRSSTRPGRAPRRPSGSTSSSPPRSSPSASSGSASSSSARPGSATRPASAASRRSSSRARRGRTRPMLTGRTRQNKLVHFPARADPARHLRRRSGSPAPAPHHLRGELVERHRPGAAPHPHPGHGRAVTPRHGHVVDLRDGGAGAGGGRAASPVPVRPGARLPGHGPGRRWARGSTRSARCVADGELWAFILRRSPKCRDLERDGRYALALLPARREGRRVRRHRPGPTGRRRRAPGHG